MINKVRSKKMSTRRKN